MKIAFMAHNRDPAIPEIDSDGGPVTIRNIAFQLANNGHTIDIYTNRFAPDQDSSDFWIARYAAQTSDTVSLTPYITVNRIDIPIPDEKLFKRTRQAQDFPEILTSLAVSHCLSLEKLLCYDRVLFFHPLSIIGYVCLKGFSQLRSALFPMLISEEYKKYLSVTDLYIELEQLALESVRCVFSASRSEADQIAARGIPMEKVVIVPRGIDKTFFYPRIRHAPSSGLLELLSIGSFRESKRQLLLVRVLSMLRTAGIDARLTFIGENLKFYTSENLGYYSNLVAAIKDSELDDYVVFKGSRSSGEVADSLRSCHIGLFPSIAESFGKAALESITTGTPTVLSDAVSAYHDFVYPSINVLTASDKASDWIHAIKLLLSNKNMYHQLSVKGAELNELMTWDRVGKIIETTINSELFS